MVRKRTGEGGKKEMKNVPSGSVGSMFFLDMLNEVMCIEGVLLVP